MKSPVIIRRFAPAMALAAMACPTLAQSAKVLSWDTLADTWVATDGLGRSLPLNDTTGPVKPNRTVGMFYFLWNEGQGPVHDLTKIFAANPEHPTYGPEHAFHHWGEPLFGYYKQDDRYVLRKHMQMLADAGVDVLLLDVTNALTYDSVRDSLLAVMDEMNALGQRTPTIAFLANSASARTVEHLYQTFYKPGKGRSHWAAWLGKPLLLAPSDGLSAEVKTFFTIRQSWAWTKGQAWFGDGRDKWPWLDHSPQTPGWHDSPTTPEQITVATAEHPITPIGRSFHAGVQPPPDQCRSAEGLYFAEQWRRALEVAPPFVMITGWNEWIAQRFIDPKGEMSMGGVKLKPGGTYFVDQFSAEFSRDIEPMQGGFGDAYYYQMVANIRKYKGTRALPGIRQVPIKIDGDFSDWADGWPVFRDTLGDAASRDHPGWQGQPPFSNKSGRNDIATAKVSADAEHVYFCVSTSASLTPRTDPNWMLLYIDADNNPKTGWLGYDWVINRSNVRPGITTLERNDGGGYQWQAVSDVEFRTAGNELEIAIPRVALGLTAESFTIDFKWADNIQQTGEWSDFTLNGDVAPNDRCNYRANFKIPLRSPQ
ncbi:MAG: hypothetical protein NTW21_28710 [Verrucomicrobia bacterium]|nr:hypothetical protein [Verrucomicrobiota bacterium]